MEKYFSFFMFVLVLNPSSVFAIDLSCKMGHWELVETSEDQWINPNTNYYCGTSIGGMSWWDKPTHCSSVIYNGRRKIEFTQGYICVPPICVQKNIANVAEAGTCMIEGTPQVYTYVPSYITWITEPCQFWRNGSGSDYGEVTIKKIVKVYEWVCPYGDDEPEAKADSDTGPPKCEQSLVTK